NRAHFRARARTLDLDEERPTLKILAERSRLWRSRVPGVRVDLLLSVPIAEREIVQLRVPRAARVDDVCGVAACALGAEVDHRTVCDADADCARCEIPSEV